MTAQFKLRLPEPLRARVEADAASNGRSMNAEIIARLERSHIADDIRTAVREAMTP